MNSVARNKKRGGRSNGSKKKGRGRSAFQEFVRRLEMQSGVEYGKAVNGMRQLMTTYQTTIPPRMPFCKGPSKDAQFSMVQYVPQNAMTLPASSGSMIVGDLIRQSSASPVFASWAFALADIANIGSVTALFDQYRIDCIQFRCRSRNNAISVYNAAAPNQAAYGPIFVVDRDDNTVPTTLAELHQYDTCLDLAVQDSIDVLIEPSITPSVFSGGAFSGYAVDDSDKYWLDVANTGIPHYGLKAGIPALQATTTSRFDWLVEAWYKVSFRNIR